MLFREAEDTRPPKVTIPRLSTAAKRDRKYAAFTGAFKEDMPGLGKEVPLGDIRMVPAFECGGMVHYRPVFPGVRGGLCA